MGRVVVSAARGRRRPGPVQAVSNGRIEGRGTSVRRGREGEGDETEGDDAREGSAAMLTTARHRRVARDAHDDAPSKHRAAVPSSFVSVRSVSVWTTFRPASGGFSEADDNNS